MSKMTKETLLKSYESGNRNFNGEDLSGLWLTNLDLSGSDFSNCDLRGTNLAKTVLQQCNFSGADLRGTNFDITDVDGSDFTNAKANWKTSMKDMYYTTDLPKVEACSVDVTRPIIQGDITTVSEEVWANEWRVNAPDKENCLSFGGSFIGTLFNENPFTCTLEEINIKKGIYPREAKKANTLSFNGGHRFEPYVAQQFVEYMGYDGHKVTLITDTNMYQHPLHPYLLCDMDYLCIVDGELCVLECKTCGYNRYEEIENLKKRILNKGYYLQVATYLSVAHLIDVSALKAKYPEITNTEINTAYVSDIWGFRADDDNMAVIKVERDEAFEAELLNRLDEMYTAIKNEEEIDLSNTDALALSDYYRRFFGVNDNDEKKGFSALTLSNSFKEILDEINLLETERKSYSSQADAIKNEKLPVLYNKLSLAFGDNIHGCMPSPETNQLYYVTRNPYERNKTLDTEMIKERFPDTYKEYQSKKIESEKLKSLLDDLENGVITVSEYRKAIESVEDFFDEERFNAMYKKKSYVVAPFSECYYQRVKMQKDGDTEKTANTFKVVIKDLKK